MHVDLGKHSISSTNPVLSGVPAGMPWEIYCIKCCVNATVPAAQDLCNLQNS